MLNPIIESQVGTQSCGGNKKFNFNSILANTFWKIYILLYFYSSFCILQIEPSNLSQNSKAHFLTELDSLSRLIFFSFSALSASSSPSWIMTHSYNRLLQFLLNILLSINFILDNRLYLLFNTLLRNFLIKPVTGGGWCAHAGILSLFTFFASSRPLLYS